MALIDDLNTVIDGGDESVAVKKILANCRRLRNSVESRKENIDKIVADASFAGVAQSIKDEGVTALAGIDTFRTFMDAHPEFFVGTPPE